MPTTVSDLLEAYVAVERADTEARQSSVAEARETRDHLRMIRQRIDQALTSLEQKLTPSQGRHVA